MRTSVKPIASTKFVSTDAAVGSIEMKADNLIDAAQLLVLYRILVPTDNEAKEIVTVRKAINRLITVEAATLLKRDPPIELRKPRKRPA